MGRWKIMCEREDGTTFHALTWRGTKERGICQAYLDAKEHGVRIKHAWAELA